MRIEQVRASAAAATLWLLAGCGDDGTPAEPRLSGADDVAPIDVPADVPGLTAVPVDETTALVVFDAGLCEDGEFTDVPSALAVDYDETITFRVEGECPTGPATDDAAGIRAVHVALTEPIDGRELTVVMTG
ncbi:MAG: hypothetical protein S0880_02245 [Actinomycetota bacterium]|nr:hypothetical protein [Actinomycetota bacterium]